MSSLLATLCAQDNEECAFACLQNNECFSFNFAIFPDVISKQRVCHLLSSEDKYRESLPLCFESIASLLYIGRLSLNGNLYSKIWLIIVRTPTNTSIYWCLKKQLCKHPKGKSTGAAQLSENNINNNKKKKKKKRKRKQRWTLIYDQ